MDEDGPVYINTVGTFGISSASYYLSRASGAVGRLTQYLAGLSSATWHMLVADDFHLEAGGTGVQICASLIFHPVCGCRCPVVVVEDSQGVIQ